MCLEFKEAEKTARNFFDTSNNFNKRSKHFRANCKCACLQHFVEKSAFYLSFMKKNHGQLYNGNLEVILNVYPKKQQKIEVCYPI